MHGVARSVVNTPLKNAPAAPSCAANSPALPPPRNAGKGTSHRPMKLSPMTKTTAVSAIGNQVSPNNWPQPSFCGQPPTPPESRKPQHAGRIPDVQRECLAAVMARLLHEREDFQADHGQHARHDIENQAAEQAERIAQEDAQIRCFQCCTLALTDSRLTPPTSSPRLATVVNFDHFKSLRGKLPAARKSSGRPAE